jgi:L-2-hydroxyglutarate oxidase LhgO
MEQVDCIVIGAGVVGLAVARELARRGRETVVVEAERGIGCGTSSRNSEVIHAGIYYPQGSLKATLCVRGRELMVGFCESHGVAHRRCGKLIVATDDAQVPTLLDLQAKGQANGVCDLELIDAAQARRLEPALACVAALRSPSTGIVDSHAFMLALQGDVEAAGGMLAFGAPVTGGAIDGDGIVLEVGGDQPMRIRATTIVNAAGLHAQALASSLAGMPLEQVPSLHLAKGSYYSLSGRSPFARLIYPVPEPGGLGVHLTIDLGGQARFGPDVEWIESPRARFALCPPRGLSVASDGRAPLPRLDYDVDPRRAQAFYASIRRYWPALPDRALVPGYAGIRPKLSGPGDAAKDFVIQGPRDHGVRGLVNLFGIESPGLTASLAIGEAVAGMLD